LGATPEFLSAVAETSFATRYYELCRLHPLRLEDAACKSSAADVLRAARAAGPAIKLPGPGRPFGFELPGGPAAGELTFVLQNRTTVETHFEVPFCLPDRPEIPSSVLSGPPSRASPNRSERRTRSPAGSLLAVVGLDATEDVGDDHRDVAYRLDVAGHAVTSQIASGGRLDICLEGAVAESPGSAGRISGDAEYRPACLGIDTAPAERAFLKEDDRERPPGIGNGPRANNQASDVRFAGFVVLRGRGRGDGAGF
jgi:hypothetical protein